MDDLERLMALMPYAAELGITIDTASADGWSATWSGRRSCAPLPG